MQRVAKNVPISIRDIPKEIAIDPQGWVFNLKYLPIPFDLLHLSVKGKDKPVSGWWTGQDWDGLNLKPVIRSLNGSGTTNMIELSITIKDEERTLTKKEILYDTNLVFSRNNEVLLSLVESVIQEFKGDVQADSPDIIIRAKMVW